MKQAEVAENVGVSTKTVQNWENGQKMPGIDNLYALAGCYNVSVAEILHDESYRLFNDRKDSRFKIVETLYIPGTVETYFELQEDNKDDYYAAWIFDPLTKYKYFLGSVMRMVPYEAFKDMFFRDKYKYVKKYRDWVMTQLGDDEEDQVIKSVLKYKTLQEEHGIFGKELLMFDRDNFLVVMDDVCDDHGETDE